MNTRKLATAAVLLALPAGAIAVPASAAARSGGKHQNHHAARGGHKGHRHGRKPRTVTFMARVVRSGANGLVVRLANGRLVSFSKRQIKPGRVAKHHKPHKGRGHRLHAAVALQVSSGNVVVNLLGLQPGVLVQITETTDANGTVTITITLPPATSSQGHATGVVTEVHGESFEVQSSDGSDLRFHMAHDALSNLNLDSCQTVEVTYHQDAGILIADSVTTTGSSTTGDCAPTSDATGTISQISATGLTVNTDQGQVSFRVDPSSAITQGYQAGDVVDVTYTTNSDGSASATDISFVESDASGQVTAVSANGASVTLTTDDSGQSETFVADPNNGVQINAHAFNGVSVGDHIDVCYHQSAGRLVADTVTEQ